MKEIIDNKPEVNSGCGSPNGCGTKPKKVPPGLPVVIANPKELHACMGLNACKGHDRIGTNSCAGMGYCATAVVHSCHTLNNCRSQGGCGLYGTAEEQNNPGNNDCSWKGSCAVPINAERFSTEGINTGKSVWKRARKVFEDKMNNNKRQFGDAPVAGGPSLDYIRANYYRDYAACGASGLSGGGNCS